jgi:hypothetical protein
MTYIPTPVVPPTTPRPSLQAIDLSYLLKATIQDFEREHPRLDPKDICMALDLVRQERRVETTVSLSAALVGLVVLLVLATALFLFAS